MPHAKLHRLTFLLAGTYNLAWGLATAIAPGWFFHFAGMHPPRYPEIFACLGMVVGLYGLLYYQVAWRLAEDWGIVAVGLLGKIVGPIGMAQLLWSGEWPMRAVWMCVFNDLVWWVPFGWFLWDAWRTDRSREIR
jgi:hypothetical protein